MSNIIEIRNLSFGYGPDLIFKNLNFEVFEGGFISIVGPNGAGKTTLLNLICGLLKPKSGVIKIDSTSIKSYSMKKLAQKIAIVRQEFVPAFEFTVAEIVSMARTPYLSTFGFETVVDRQIVKDAVEMTDTTKFISRPLSHLSSGERQRVFIARAIAQETPILLLDEPTTFLDMKHQVNIYDLLKNAQKEKSKTIISVTHDINLAAQYSDKVLVLGPENTYLCGKTSEVLSQKQIESFFGISTFSANVGQEKFFLPLGKFAKDFNVIRENPEQPSKKLNL